MELGKCARCGKVYSRPDSNICRVCQPLEDADFDKVRDVLDVRAGLNAQELAEQAKVEVETVFRFLDTGRLESMGAESIVPCGRCGARAISSTKRLCQACLTKLDQECAEAMREMRERMKTEVKGEVTEMRKALEEKRERRKVPEPGKPRARRMVAQELRKNDRRR